MALTEAQINSVAMALGRTPEEVDDQIVWLGDLFTAQIETDIETQLTRWAAVSSDFVSIHPNLKNYGAEINPGREKDDIRKNLALLLNRTDWTPGGGAGGSVSGGTWERG